MEEIITLDGKQFKLMSDHPLTALERQQTISDIRRQSGCSSCNKTQSLGNGIQNLAVFPCVDITVTTPASVAITHVTIEGVDCTTGTCLSSLLCSTDCPNVLATVVVTFENTGDTAAAITPTLKIGTADVGTLTDTVPIPIDGLGTATATYTGVVLAKGKNTVCADLTFV